MTSLVAELGNALFAGVVHSTWQGSALALIYWLTCDRVQNAHSRYLLGMLLLTLAILGFFATISLAYQPSTATPVPTQYGVAQGTPVPLFFAIAWCFGACFVGGRYLCAALWLQAVIVRKAIPAPSVIQTLFDCSKRALRIPDGVLLRVSERIHSPMIVGVAKPVVLIPVSMVSGVPHSVLNAVFAHELMHLRRFDHIALVIQALGESVLFFHPAVLWLSKEVRRDREYRCDDDSIQFIGDKYDYARALVSLEQRRNKSTIPALMMNGGDLMERVQRLLVDKPSVRTGRFGVSGLVGMMAIVFALYSVEAISDVDAVAEPPISDSSAVSIRWLPPSVMQWQVLIEQSAAKHSVPADLLALMLLKESAGNENATSSAGAVGLMQVMPKTAISIAKQRGISGFTEEQLFDPKTNLDFGAWYLATQLAKFSDADESRYALAVSAYNAGSGAVRAYLMDGKPLPNETVGYRDLLLSMLAERELDSSATLDGYLNFIRRKLYSDTLPVRGEISSTFGLKAARNDIHNGVDFKARTGEAVIAPIAGDVSNVGEDTRRGKFVTVRHAEGIESHYYHLSDVTVTPGTRVEDGDTLGEVGSTGVSTGPHLHFEIREYGRPVSPSLYGIDIG